MLPVHLANFELHDVTLHDILPQAPLLVLPSHPTPGPSASGTSIPGANVDLQDCNLVIVLDTPVNKFGVF